jgi:hypothetical protein
MQQHSQQKQTVSSRDRSFISKMKLSIRTIDELFGIIHPHLAPEGLVGLNGGVPHLQAADADRIMLALVCLPADALVVDDPVRRLFDEAVQYFARQRGAPGLFDVLVDGKPPDVGLVGPHPWVHAGEQRYPGKTKTPAHAVERLHLQLWKFSLFDDRTNFLRFSRLRAGTAQVPAPGGNAYLHRPREPDNPRGSVDVPPASVTGRSRCTLAESLRPRTVMYHIGTDIFQQPPPNVVIS